MVWGRGMLGTFGACAAGGLEGYFLELPTRKNIQIHTRTNGETLKTLTDHHLNTLQPQRFTPPPPKNKSGKKARHPYPPFQSYTAQMSKCDTAFYFTKFETPKTLTETSDIDIRHEPRYIWWYEHNPESTRQS